MVRLQLPGQQGKRRPERPRAARQLRTGRLALSLVALLTVLIVGLWAPHGGPANGFAAPLVAPDRPSAQQATPQPESKAPLVGQAFTLISNNYFRPLDAAALLNAAWDAAVAAAAGAGNVTPPQRPLVTGNANAALVSFQAAYQQLENATPLDRTTLAYAAIHGMTQYINNCHTGFLTPTQAATRRAMTAGGTLIGPGLIRETSRPWVLDYVVPGGPADLAGMRAGDTVLAYDGDTSDDAPMTHARLEGQTLTYTIQRPGEATTRDFAVTFGQYQFPEIETRVIDGDVGYIRFFSWESKASQAQAIRDAVAGFEAQGVTSLVLDMRANGGGVPSLIANLFLPAGPYLQLVTRDGQDTPYVADGSAIAPALPLAILIGPGSASASEIVPEAIREAGLAVLIGQHTPGCMAFSSDLRLSDGSVVVVTVGHALIGASPATGLELEGIGVQPDIVAPRTAEDLADGADPGLDAAMQYLEGVTDTAQPVAGR